MGRNPGTRSLSIAICTRNRAAMLDRCLASIAGAERPAGFAVQLVVVLNDCSDGSADVVARWSRRTPLTVVTEPRPGLSHARNAAVARADGAFVLWTDDDCVVRPDWILRYADAIERLPDAGVLGGTIRPVFEGAPPDWLLASLELCAPAFAALSPDGHDAPILAVSGAFPFGANFAVRTVHLRRHAFDPRLGRQPGRVLLGAEEGAVILAVLESGARGYWIPEAVVEHRIDAARQTTAYLSAYFAGQAFVQARHARETGRALPPLWHDVRAVVRAWMPASRRGSDVDRIRALIEVARARGRLRARFTRA